MAAVLVETWWLLEHNASQRRPAEHILRTVHTQRSWAWLRGGHFEWFLLWWNPCLKICRVSNFYRLCSWCTGYKLLLLWPQTCRAWLKFCQSHAHRLKLKTDSLSLLSILLPDTAYTINSLHALWLVHDLSPSPIWDGFLESLSTAHHIIMEWIFFC